jgi:hypothetical protein
VSPTSRREGSAWIARGTTPAPSPAPSPTPNGPERPEQQIPQGLARDLRAAARAVVGLLEQHAAVGVQRTSMFVTNMFVPRSATARAPGDVRCDEELRHALLIRFVDRLTRSREPVTLT